MRKKGCEGEKKTIVDVTTQINQIQQQIEIRRGQWINTRIDKDTSNTGMEKNEYRTVKYTGKDNDHNKTNKTTSSQIIS